MTTAIPMSAGEFTGRLQASVTVARALEAASDNAVVVSVVIPCLNEEEGVGGVVEPPGRGSSASGSRAR